MTDRPVDVIDIQALDVAEAECGKWRSIRIILRDAIENIRVNKPIHPGRGLFNLNEEEIQDAVNLAAVRFNKDEST